MRKIPPSLIAQEDTRRRSRLVFQTLGILLIPLSFALVGPFFLGPVPPFDAPTRILVFGIPPPMIVIAIFCSALIILLRLGQPSLSALMLIGAWTLLTTVGALRFGVTSNFPAMLIMPICAAGLLIDRFASLSLAALASLLVIGSAWADAGQSQALVSGSPTAFLQSPLLSALFWISLFWTVAALTSLLAGGLQQALRQSRAQAEELRLLSDQLESRVALQTEQILSQERETATLAERTRLAREIHDTLAQGLTGIVVQLGAARRASAAAQPAAADHLDLAERMAREALAEARRSVWNMRSPALERGDLSDALRGLAERQGQFGVPTAFELVGEPYPLRPEAESALLRVAQESLANVIKHAEASSAGLTLSFGPQRICMTVSDDGRGFSPESLASPPQPGPWGGFGLTGMRERLAALGGAIELYNQGGAVVSAWVPRK